MSLDPYEPPCVRFEVAPDGAVVRRLDDLDGVAQEALRTAQALVADVRPPDLGAGELEAAVRAAARRVADKTGVRAAVSVSPALSDPGGPLRGQQAVDVFGVVQEALSNVARHAGATRVEVRLGHETGPGPGRAVVEVADDGRGIGGEAPHPGAVGLLDAAARVEAWGGTLAVGPRPGGGTVLVASVPLAVPSRSSRHAA